MTKGIKDNIVALLQLVLVLGGCFALVWGVGFAGAYFFHFREKNYHVDSTWKETIGTLTTVRRIGKGASPSIFNYKYNDTFYNLPSYVDYDAVGSIVGEKCMLKVNSMRPDHYVPLNSKPVFTEDESRKIDTGIVSSIYSSGGKYYSRKSAKLVFLYAVDGERFRREQEIPLDYATTYGNLKVNQKYEVEYWVNNPRRAIIHLDRPIN